MLPPDAGDAGDGRHGRDGQVVRHRVRHAPLDVPRRRRGGALLRLCRRRRRHVLGLGRHLVPTGQAPGAPRVRHLPAATLVVELVGGAAREEGPRCRCRRRRQAEEGACLHGGAEEGVLAEAGTQVAALEPLDAGVEVADAACHGLLPQQPHGRAGWEGEEGEEEVDGVLAGLGEHHARPRRPRVHQELHGDRRRCVVAGRALFITNNRSSRTMTSYAARTHSERLIGGPCRHELHQTPSSLCSREKTGSSPCSGVDLASSCAREKTDSSPCTLCKT
ncbi:uncharacterized protein LOC123412239 isoform X2 [Hordeum vulgare subsp. vulgare]|uniref:uncharacterized protein LOC123412239 isoform X2 n=1 Tax=Hordeum vulgare subsp. vulgare TaxID=112509 RepID=UPI001D1A5561|nr:uncharacterized protein LOC123412239 isoform X2 [Hordeum vulgare subsp. vulgare]